MPHKNNKPKVIPLVFDTYLAVIKNSVGSKLFRTLYAKVNGKKTDITQKGELSCAFYASSVLVIFKFINRIHGTVDGTVKDLQECGWKKISKPKIGSVLVWEKVDFKSGEAHKHIGFFVGSGKAISNNYKLHHPTQHSWNFNGKRKVEAIFWNSKLLKVDKYSK